MIYRMIGSEAPTRSFFRARRPPPYRPGPTRASDIAIGARLRRARLLAGAAPGDLAAALGVGAKTLDGYEAGTRHVPARRLVAAARFLGIPVASLFGDDSDPLKS
jgi:Helix-turn-helix domain